MSNLIPMHFDGAQIRVVEIDGEPWFVGKDVAEALGYANATDAINTHCRGVAKRYPILDSLGRTQEARVLSEPDVLRLIVSSKLPAAERFERWVFEEVLPAVRKTGKYEATPQPAPTFQIPQSMGEALRLAADLADQNRMLDQKIEEQKPKVEALERLAVTKGDFCISDAAKVLGFSPPEFFKWLSDRAWIFRRSNQWVPAQKRQNDGYLVLKPVIVGDSGRSIVQTRITSRGLTRIAEVLAKEKRWEDKLRREAEERYGRETLQQFIASGGKVNGSAPSM